MRNGVNTVLPAGKCDKCGRMRKRAQGIECRSCGKVLHVVCADLGSRTQADRVDRSDWKCRECVVQRMRVEASERAAEEDGVLRGVKNVGSGHPAITVAQWNCDHLRAKIPELEVWLRKYDVDVALVQETKLREEDGEVRVRGYEVVRRDRWREGRSRWSRGGGLVTLVRSGWSYRVMSSGVRPESGMEVLNVRVMDGDAGVWNIVNVYVPPESRERVTEDDWRGLPGGGAERWLVCGDFNAHHSDWDERVRPDRRGELLMSWAGEREMVLLNDGAVTRVDRGSGGPPSSPDVSWCSRAMSSESEWSVKRELSSDHYPIVMKFGVKSEREEPRKMLVWDWKRADWKGYAEEVRSSLMQYDWERMSVSDMEWQLSEVILNAAKKFVKRKRLRANEEHVVGEEVLSAMNRRDAERNAEEVNAEELLRADEEVKRLLREERKRE